MFIKLISIFALTLIHINYECYSICLIYSSLAQISIDNITIMYQPIQIVIVLIANLRQLRQSTGKQFTVRNNMVLCYILGFERSYKEYFGRHTNYTFIPSICEVINYICLYQCNEYHNFGSRTCTFYQITAREYPM